MRIIFLILTCFSTGLALAEELWRQDHRVSFLKRSVDSNFWKPSLQKRSPFPAGGSTPQRQRQASGSTQGSQSRPASSQSRGSGGGQPKSRASGSTQGAQSRPQSPARSSSSATSGSSMSWGSLYSGSGHVHSVPNLRRPDPKPTQPALQRANSLQSNPSVGLINGRNHPVPTLPPASPFSLGLPSVPGTLSPQRSGALETPPSPSKPPALQRSQSLPNSGPPDNPKALERSHTAARPPSPHAPLRLPRQSSGASAGGLSYSSGSSPPSPGLPYDRLERWGFT